MDDVRVAARDKRRRIYPFKIKLTLPEEKTVDIIKNNQVVKTMNIRRKSKYFNEGSALIF